MAFEDLKKFLTSPPVLTASLASEELLLYISATTNVVNTTIALERQEEGHLQPVKRPVYYITEVPPVYFSETWFWLSLMESIAR